MDANEKNSTHNHERVYDQEKLREIGEQHAEQLNEARSEKHENQPERTVEQARAEVERVTHEQERQKNNEQSRTIERRPIEAKKDKKSAYRKTMDEVDRHLSPAQRTFSHFIHHPAVEKASEVVGGTIARPNAILFGSVFAFIFTLAIYVVASKYGYPLSGAETIASFAAGWLFGQLFDYFRVMITGKR